jgi:hypothetical protein
MGQPRSSGRAAGALITGMLLLAAACADDGAEVTDTTGPPATVGDDAPAPPAEDADAPDDLAEAPVAAPPEQELDADAPRDIGTVAWEVGPATSAGFAAPFAVVWDADRGEVRVLDPFSGVDAATVGGDELVRGAGAGSGMLVYISGAHGRTEAISVDLATMDVATRTSVPDVEEYRVAVAVDTAIVHLSGAGVGRILAFHVETGDPLWELDDVDEVDVTWAVGEEALLVVRRADGSVAGVEGIDGRIRWEQTPSEAAAVTFGPRGPEVDGDRLHPHTGDRAQPGDLLVVNELGAPLAAIGLDGDGEPVTVAGTGVVVPAGFDAWQALVTFDVVYLLGSAGIVALDLETGAELSRAPGRGDAPRRLLAVVEGRLLVDHGPEVGLVALGS